MYDATTVKNWGRKSETMLFLATSINSYCQPMARDSGHIWPLGKASFVNQCCVCWGGSGQGKLMGTLAATLLPTPVSLSPSPCALHLLEKGHLVTSAVQPVLELLALLYVLHSRSLGKLSSLLSKLVRLHLCLLLVTLLLLVSLTLYLLCEAATEHTLLLLALIMLSSKWGCWPVSRSTPRCPKLVSRGSQVWDQPCPGHPWRDQPPHLHS